MAETNISADKVTGAVIEADHVNELKSAMVTTFSGRNAAGQVTKSQNLGSALFPWGTLFADSLVIDGLSIDVSLLASEANIIKSGQVRSTSDQADFIRVDGATNEATIDAASTDLVYIVNGTTVTLAADILLTTLTVASSGATEECLINDTTLTDQEESKFLGGEDDTIPVDTMGASISAKVGQVVCLQKGSELMLAFVKSTTELTNVKRGYFFDSSGNPIVRETLANNDILTLMSLGYVFLQDDAASFEVSFLNPIYSFDAPGSPATGQYWFDLTNKQWKRFDGAVFEIIQRILIGLVIIDTANAIGSRSLDFDLAYSDLNSLSYDEFSDTTITSKDIDNSISVNANNLNTRENRIIFDITTDRATGVSETSSTRYYAYISQDGQRRIDIERPYELNPFLKGYYHPYQSWRCVASFNNDSGSDIDSVIDIDELIDPAKATLTEVNAGVNDTKFITPSTLSNSNFGVVDFIEEKTASNDSEIDFINLTQHSSYYILLQNVIPITNQVTLNVRVSDDNGSSFKAGASDYRWTGTRSTDGSELGSPADSSDSEIEITASGSSFGLSNDGNTGYTGRIDLLNPLVTDREFFIRYEGSYQQVSVGRFIHVNGSGNYQANAAINAIRFLISSGNISSGKFRLYGIR